VSYLRKVWVIMMTLYLLPWLIMLVLIVLGVIGSMFISLPLYRSRIRRLERRNQDNDLYSVLFSTNDEMDYY
jgi:hypothetical protein